MRDKEDIKFQKTNSKSQINSKFQIPMTQTKTSHRGGPAGRPFTPYSFRGRDGDGACMPDLTPSLSPEGEGGKRIHEIFRLTKIKQE